MDCQHLAIWGSGTGTNAQALIQYFKERPAHQVSLVVSNKPNAGILGVAKQNDIPFEAVDQKALADSTVCLQLLSDHDIDWIILAGFLWYIPSFLTEAYRDRIVNIHPSLLPKYGGKGMYGHHVHRAVLEAQESETGITIHLVNEHYDEGRILFQAACEVRADDSVESLSKRVQQLEHQHYGPVLDQHIHAYTHTNS